MIHTKYLRMYSSYLKNYSNGKAYPQRILSCSLPGLHWTWLVHPSWNIFWLSLGNYMSSPPQGIAQDSFPLWSLSRLNTVWIKSLATFLEHTWRYLLKFTINQFWKEVRHNKKAKELKKKWPCRYLEEGITEPDNYYYFISW